MFFLLLILLIGIVLFLPINVLNRKFLLSFKNLIFVGADFVNYNRVSVILTVLFVTFFVIVFSCFYIKEDKTLPYFLFIILLFVVSILVLRIADSLFFIFIGWDGLGVTSFVLIIYYNNWKSINNALFTLLRNRVGDSLILLFFGLILWDFSFNTFVFFGSTLLILFIFITKRAQVPISAWLPAAMAAPTPVSALVHSSTLVTAGIVLLIKFYFVIINTDFQKLLLLVGVVTIFIAGLTTLIEIDFKKLVALSTLRQMGILVFVLGLGRKWLCVFHLVSHAFFKRCLFLVVGGALHFLFSKQDWRSFGVLINFSLAQRVTLFLCCVCLCGLFFTRGFISKDIILDFIRRKQLGIFVLIVFLVRLALTFIYCLRLFSCFLKRTRSGRGALWFSKEFVGIEFRPNFLLLIALILCYWLFFGWKFSFSSLVREKLFLLFMVVRFLFFLCRKLLKHFLMKTMFFLDIFYKKIKIDSRKRSRETEKVLLDYFFNFWVFVFYNSSLKVRGLFFNTGGFLVVVVSLFLGSCFVLL